MLLSSRGKKSGNMENEGYKYCAHLSKAEKVKFVEKVLIVIKTAFYSYHDVW